MKKLLAKAFIAFAVLFPFLVALSYGALTDNLISVWELEETSGNALDSYGSNTLTEGSTVGSGGSPVGLEKSRDFESTESDYFSIASNSTLQAGDIDFTIQAWVNFESLGADRIIVSKWAGSGNFEYILFYDHDTTSFIFFITNDGTTGFKSVSATTFGAPGTSTWYLLHAWHDSVNNQIGISVNAGSADTASHSTGVYVGTSEFDIGRQPSTNYNDGLISQVAFWKKVLTSDERTQLYNSGLGLNFSAWDGSNTGYNVPTSTGTGTWTSPENAFASDDSRATAPATMGGGEKEHTFKTFGFDSELPVSLVSIDSVTVRVEGFPTGGVSTNEIKVYVSTNNCSTFSAAQSKNLAASGSDQTLTFNASWGISFTRAMMLDGSFCVKVANNDITVSSQIDSVSAKVNFTDQEVVAQNAWTGYNGTGNGGFRLTGFRAQ